MGTYNKKEEMKWLCFILLKGEGAGKAYSKLNKPISNPTQNKMSVQIYSCSAFLKMHLQSEKSLNNHKIPEHLHFLARLSKQRWDRGIRQSSRWKPF